MDISMVGCGYVGLVTGACFAEMGNSVVCIDTDKTKVDMINRAKAPIHEQGLPRLLRRHVLMSKRLRATTDLREAVMATDMTFICVGTPENKDGSIDLKYIKQATQQIGEVLKDKTSFHTVIVKSTVVPSTTDLVVKPILETASGKTAGKDFGLANNPELLRESVAISDFMKPDRVVIGIYDELSGKLIEQLYEKLPAPKVIVNLREAEMTKYGNNFFSANKISSINQLANVCEQLGGADINNVARCLGMDARIGNNFLFAGVGWGGSCFEKDLRAITNQAKSLNIPVDLFEAVRAINIFQRNHVIDKIGDVKGKTIAVVGLAFKPNTDDMRHAPSITIIEAMLKKGAKVKACDPIAIKNAKKIFGDRISYSTDIETCIKNADISVILTEWDEYHIEPKVYKKLMRGKKVVDGRRILNPIQAKKVGLDYYGVGYGK